MREARNAVLIIRQEENNIANIIENGIYFFIFIDQICELHIKILHLTYILAVSI